MWVQDSIAVLDDLLQHALEGLQVKAQLDTGNLPRKAPKQTAMKVTTVVPLISDQGYFRRLSNSKTVMTSTNISLSVIL